MSFDLLEVLKNSIRGFFSEFHRKHMERLCLFLDHESWEYVPVRHGFSFLDLHVSFSHSCLVTNVLLNCDALINMLIYEGGTHPVV